jgi:proline iminopeptidase
MLLEPSLARIIPVPHRRLHAATLAAFLWLAATLPAQSVPHASGVAHTGPVDIAWETFGTRGSALPVICVNGGPGLSRAYMKMSTMWFEVARHRLVVFYDQRGTGESKRLVPGAPQTMDAQVDDLEALRAHLGLDKVVLVGDSFGGWISMAYIAAHPEHVARLVLSDSPGPTWKDTVHLLPQTFPDIEAEDAAATKNLGGDSDAAARLSLRNHFRMIFYSPAKRDTYMAAMGDLGYEPAVARAMSESAGTHDFTATLAGIRCPTLVINGRDDMNVAPLTAWNMAHAIPGAKLVFFEESGHLPSYEEPDRYRAVLEEFLNAP